jgi:hypothetical protein
MSISDASNSGDDPEKIIERHIKLLHDYNESKDAAQVLLDVMHDTHMILTPPQALMGKLAVIHGTTVRQLHEKFGLSKDD